MTETATLRFKKAITKVGSAGGKVLSGALQRVAADGMPGLSEM